MKVYKVHCNNNWCAFESIEQAVEFLKIDIEAEIDNLSPGDETGDYRIAVVEMTKEEFDALPEFDGY